MWVNPLFCWLSSHVTVWAPGHSNFAFLNFHFFNLPGDEVKEVVPYRSSRSCCCISSFETSALALLGGCSMMRKRLLRHCSLLFRSTHHDSRRFGFESRRADLPEAMYATMGYIVPEYYKFPGYLSPSLGLKFADVPNGLAALSKPSAYLQAAHAAHAMSFHISFEFQHLCRCKEQNGWR